MMPLGLRCSVGYSDQNESFAPFLPRSGVVSRQIELTDSTLPWFVFTLEEPFEYEGQRIDYFVIAARWIGHPISGSDFTSLFVLLDPQNHAEARCDVSTRDFLHICWGEIVHATVKT
jgi:hypothetical protein